MKTSTATMLVYMFLFSVIIGGALLVSTVPMVAASTIQATVNIDPDKINLRNPPSSWKSPYVMAFIRFPKPYKEEVLNINFSTVLLDGVIPALWDEATKYTYKVFFDRQAVLDYLWFKLAHMGYTDLPFKNVPVELTVTGKLYDKTPFEGSDIVIVSAK